VIHGNIEKFLNRIGRNNHISCASFLCFFCLEAHNRPKFDPSDHFDGCALPRADLLRGSTDRLSCPVPF